MTPKEHTTYCERTVRFFVEEFRDSQRMYERTATRQRAMGLGDLAKESDDGARSARKDAERLERFARRIEKHKKEAKK